MPKLTVKNAFVCIECDSLSSNPKICQYCLSYQVWPLKEWLGELPEIRARVVSKPWGYTNPHQNLKSLPEKQETALVHALWPVLTGIHDAFCPCTACRDLGKRRVM